MADDQANDATTVAVLEQFRPKRPLEKSAAQLLLERQEAARVRLGTAAVDLRRALENIRGQDGRPPVGAESSTPGIAPKPQTQFFAAMEAITNDLERLALSIEGDAKELLARF